MGSAVVMVGLRANIEPERSLPAEGCDEIDSDKSKSCGDLVVTFGVDPELRGYPKRGIVLFSEEGNRSSSSSSVVLSA